MLATIFASISKVLPMFIATSVPEKPEMFSHLADGANCSDVLVVRIRKQFASSISSFTQPS